MPLEAEELLGAPPSSPGFSPRPIRTVVPRRDLWGVALAAAAAGWSLVAASFGGAAEPVIGLIAASTLAFVTGRLLGSVVPWLVPAGIVLFAGALLAIPGSGVTDGDPLGGPLGYANAEAALFVQASLAAVMLAFSLRRSVPQIAAGAAALAFAAISIIEGSLAAFMLLALAALALLAGTIVRARSLVGIAAVLFVAALGISIALGAAHGSDGGRPFADAAADAGLSDLRLELWHEALVIMRDHPVTGVGPGRFAFFSPTARENSDASQAHNEFLQQGAEQGVPGSLLAGGLFLWAFWRLGSVPRPGLRTVVAAAAVAALGIHASIDYILHFPAVPLAAAALLGAATADGEPEHGGSIDGR